MNSSEMAGSPMSPRRLAVAVFLLLALWVHPTQPAVTKVKGTSKDATVTPRVTHSLSPFAPCAAPTLTV